MLHGRKEVSFVSIIMFILRPDALSLNGSVMINLNLNLHLKWYSSIMPVNFHLEPKVFLHDFTLTTSVVGGNVIGHGTGGKHIPAKMV